MMRFVRSVRSGSARRVALGAVAVSAVVVLAGCVGEGDDSTPGENTSAGGTMNIVQSSDIQLNGWFGQTQPNLAIQRLLFNSLVQQDVATGEPTPSLASSWELSDDETQISFVLRDDVLFHDGTSLTADDVMASIDTLRAEGIPTQVKAIANLITEMESASETELTLTLDHAVTNLFDLFEMMPVVDDATVDQLLEGQEFNGTGPFQVDEYTPGQKIEMTRFDDYWGGPANLDGVTITVVRDSQAMLTSLRSGQSQVAVDLAPLDAVAIKDDPAFEIYNAPAADAGYYVASNVNVPLLSDPQVRRAIATAIDRERILDQVLGGNGVITSLPWTPSSAAFDESLQNTYEFDASAAAAALEEAGAAGESVKVFYDANSGIMTGIAQVIIYDLEQAGLLPEGVPLQTPEFLTRLRGGELDGLFVNVHGFGQLSPATLVTGAFPFNAAGNASQFVDPTYQELAEAIWVETDEAASAENIAALNDFLLEQQFVIDLISSYHTYALSTTVKGFETTILDYPILDTASLG